MIKEGLEMKVKENIYLGSKTIKKDSTACIGLIRNDMCMVEVTGIGEGYFSKKEIAKYFVLENGEQISTSKEKESECTIIECEKNIYRSEKEKPKMQVSDMATSHVSSITIEPVIKKKSIITKIKDKVKGWRQND